MDSLRACATDAASGVLSAASTVLPGLPAFCGCQIRNWDAIKVPPGPYEQPEGATAVGSSEFTFLWEIP